VNKVILLGNIGQAPETRTLRNGTLLTTASLATNERFKQGDEWKDRTEWHSVLFYGRLAEIARDYLRKGSKVYVEGRIRTDSWDDKDTGRKQWRTHIVATDLTLLDSQGSRPPQTPDDVLASDNYGYGASSKATTAPSPGDDDIPF
jgi:single-strand DNA-binding protein